MLVTFVKWFHIMLYLKIVKTLNRELLLFTLYYCGIHFIVPKHVLCILRYIVLMLAGFGRPNMLMLFFVVTRGVMLIKSGFLKSKINKISTHVVHIYFFNTFPPHSRYPVHNLNIFCFLFYIFYRRTKSFNHTKASFSLSLLIATAYTITTYNAHDDFNVRFNNKINLFEVNYGFKL